MSTKRDRARVQEVEDDGEEPELIFVERQFPVILRYQLIWGLVIILVAMVPWSIATANLYSWQPLAINWLLFGFLVLLFYWGYHFVGWYFTVLILTDEDITFIQQKGLFRRDVQSLTLNNVQSVNYKIPGLQAAIFKFGDLKIETLSGSGHLNVRTMHKPAQLQADILAALQAYGSTGDDTMVYDSKDKTDQE